MDLIPFSKYSGCGNDFIMIDHRNPFFNTDAKKVIHALCHRNQGIGADGIIFLETGTATDFKMRIFNQDGSEAEMCGNGLRCFALFILELGYSEKPYTVETMERTLSVEFIENAVKTSMGALKNTPSSFSLEIDHQQLTGYLLNTGVPHAIVFVDDLVNAQVRTIGAKIRNHTHFLPQGVNANFATKNSENEISVRTFERGVEDETFACGTGACAAAIAATFKWGMKPPIKVKMRSNESLEVNFMQEKQTISQITQTGPARKLFHGTFDIRGYL